MKKLLVAFSLILSTSPCFALLSPLNQSLEEVQTIFLSKDLQKKIPQDQRLTQIQRVSNGYLVTTEKMQMLVEIQYTPNEKPGKQQFKLVFHDPVSIPQRTWQR